MILRDEGVVAFTATSPSGARKVDYIDLLCGKQTRRETAEPITVVQLATTCRQRDSSLSLPARQLRGR